MNLPLVNQNLYAWMKYLGTVVINTNRAEGRGEMLVYFYPISLSNFIVTKVIPLLKV